MYCCEGSVGFTIRILRRDFFHIIEMHKKKGRRGRPKVRCSPRNERFPWSGGAGLEQQVGGVPPVQDGGVPQQSGGAHGDQGGSAETDLTIKNAKMGVFETC